MPRVMERPSAGREVARWKCGRERELVVRVNGGQVDVRYWTEPTDWEAGLPTDVGLVVPGGDVEQLRAALSVAAELAAAAASEGGRGER